MQPPFHVLPYLVYLHREIALPYRLRAQAYAERDRFLTEAEARMLALEEGQRSRLSPTAFLRAQGVNRQHLESLRAQADNRTRAQLAVRLCQMESQLWHLHAEPFRVPPELLSALEQATDDDRRTVALQAIADFMLWFLRIPLSSVLVWVKTHGPADPVSCAAGTYSAPNRIRVHRRPADRPSRLLAILAHEMCHHLLHQLGIHAPTGFDEEQLTDAATIYFNFTPMMVPEYRRRVEVVGDTVICSSLGYLPPEQLECADHYSRRIQRGATDFRELLEEGGLRVRPESLGHRIMLPLESDFHGIVSFHRQDRLQVHAYDLLAHTEAGAPPPEVMFVTNKLAAFLGTGVPARGPAKASRARRALPRRRRQVSAGKTARPGVALTGAAARQTGTRRTP